MSRSTVEVDLAYLNALEDDAKRLNKRKAYGYGIVDKDGKPAFGVTLTKSSADMHIRAYRDAGKAGHRVVELFYEDSES